MQRKYPDCIIADSNCTDCSQQQACYGKPITQLAWERTRKGLSQRRLADLAGVRIRLIRRIEAGEQQASDISARNLIRLADALEVDPRILLEGALLIC